MIKEIMRFMERRKRLIEIEKRLMERRKRFVEIYCFHNHNQSPQITAVFFNHGCSAVFHQSQPFSINHGCLAISNLQFLIYNCHG